MTIIRLYGFEKLKDVASYHSEISDLLWMNRNPLGNMTSGPLCLITPFCCGARDDMWEQ